MTVYIIGAGPAGMTAGIAAADNGNSVVILERNEKIGKKLYITGKGRCNFTNRCEFAAFTENIVTNKKFLYSALKKFDCNDAVNMMESVGIKMKTERGNRVFPESDKSSDVLKGFSRLLSERGVTVKLNERVTDLVIENGEVKEIVTSKEVYRDVSAVVVATGGTSYPATGSTGDGYVFAEKAGLKTVPTVPALTGIYLSALTTPKGAIRWEDIPKIQGISLKNVTLTAYCDGKSVSSEFGEALFTDKGIGGPIVLTTSSRINRLSGKIVLVLDLKPALSEETLDGRLLRDFDANKNKALKNVLGGLVPSGLIPVILLASGLDGDQKVNCVTKEERKGLIKALKELTFRFKSLEPQERAVVTSGGVAVTEIDPKNMRSKKVKNLYFAGEVLDVDALTGGYNIQIALSTGHCAGSHIFTEE